MLLLLFGGSDGIKYPGNWFGNAGVIAKVVKNGQKHPIFSANSRMGWKVVISTAAATAATVLVMCVIGP